MTKIFHILHLCILAVLSIGAHAATSDHEVASKCPEVKIEVERLSDLNIPRAGHELFCVNGEYVVAGGHTNGFVPTQTAEYYKDGQWHLMQMVYSHDCGFSVVLKSGKVLLAGGCEQNIGVGQTYTAEMYNPVSHTFNGFGSMDQKRTLASALELDSGKVVIAGNWYHQDGIELFDGKRTFSYVKDLTVQGSNPYIFRIAEDDALIINTWGIRGDTIQTLIADRLNGDPISIPLFETWHPKSASMHHDAESFIGDEAKGLYAYLLPVQDSTGQTAIAKVENGVFTLLPTVCPIPMQSQWEKIEYTTNIIVDQQAGRGYLLGINSEFRNAPEKPYRYYILCIDYAQATEEQGAPLTLYYTDPIDGLIANAPALTHDGNLLMTGGFYNGSNFTPSASVYLLHLSQQTGTAKGGNSLWLVLLLILAVFVVAAILLFRKKRRPTPLETDQPDASEPEQDTIANDPEASQALMDRICQLLEEQKLYQNSDLKVTDIAAALHSNRRFISDCINSQRRCSFTQFINGYRIEHAKRILRQEPNKKIADVYVEAGFANEQSFFRTFKAITGMTPSEWKAQ